MYSHTHTFYIRYKEKIILRKMRINNKLIPVIYITLIVCINIVYIF